MIRGILSGRGMLADGMVVLCCDAGSTERVSTRRPFHLLRRFNAGLPRVSH